MKRVMTKAISLLLALALLIVPVCGMAEVLREEPAPGPDGAYSWAYLASIGGTAAAVLLIVQYLKGYLDKLVHIHTRLVVLALSIVIQIGSKAVLHGLNWPDVPLLILNGFVAATSAMGMYEVTFAKKEQTPKVGL